jgi:hypothetical protein
MVEIMLMSGERAKTPYPSGLPDKEAAAHLFMSGLVYEVCFEVDGHLTGYYSRDDGPRLVEWYWRHRV